MNVFDQTPLPWNETNLDALKKAAGFSVSKWPSLENSVALLRATRVRLNDHARDGAKRKLAAQHEAMDRALRSGEPPTAVMSAAEAETSTRAEVEAMNLSLARMSLEVLPEARALLKDFIEAATRVATDLEAEEILVAEKFGLSFKPNTTVIVIQSIIEAFSRRLTLPDSVNCIELVKGLL